MYRAVCFIFCWLLTCSVGAQNLEAWIQASEVERVEQLLSSDRLEGRKVFTPGIDRAAELIAGEMARAGLQPLTSGSYFQEFSLQQATLLKASGSINGRPVLPAQLCIFSTQPRVSVSSTSGYRLIPIQQPRELWKLITRLQEEEANAILIMDTLQQGLFRKIQAMERASLPAKNSIVFVLTSTPVSDYQFEFIQEVHHKPLKNVVGLIPGSARKDEVVIFSAHYDHLGIGTPNAQRDSIYNGANDDATGTTAVLQLARYFNQLRQNTRTLIFVAFTAEEIGGYGSLYFSQQYDPNKIVALFNVEMIGTESKWGPNSAYLTGFEQSDMGKILQDNVKGSPYSIYPDPYPEQQLFFRSDNIKFARWGVPAHTLSTSRMEADPEARNKDADVLYHTPDDEHGSLDMRNMTAIIKAIARSAQSIITGKDTPGRIPKRAED